MKKASLILFLLYLSINAFGQNQSYKGFYQTQFFNVFGDVKVIEAEFEVKDNNAITGSLKIGNVTKVLQGQVEPKGKFEARTEMENGVVTLIKGEFPITKNAGKVSLIQRTEQKGNGSKSSSGKRNQRIYQTNANAYRIKGCRNRGQRQNAALVSTFEAAFR